MNRRDVDTIGEQAQIDLVYALAIVERLARADGPEDLNALQDDAVDFLIARKCRRAARLAARPPCEKCGEPSDFTVGGISGCYPCANNVGDP